MTYNIRHGEGMDNVVDLDRQSKVIQNALPDVVGLQEVDSIVPRSGSIDETAYLANSLGMYGTFGPAIPYKGGKYGVAILSKECPLSVRNIPLPGTEKRTLLVCEFENYVFANTHLDLTEEHRLASVPIIIEEASRWDKPFFICGDWNDKPSSKLIKTMKKSFFFLNNTLETSTTYTFPADTPNSIIDYIASYGKVIKSLKSRRVINEPKASDHRPIIIEVTLEHTATDIHVPSACNEAMTDGKIYDLGGKQITHRNKLPKGIHILKNRKQKTIKTS